MTRIDIIPAPRHRGIFPGEITLQLLCSNNDQSHSSCRQPIGVYIGIQNEEWLDEAEEERQSDEYSVEKTYVEHAGTFYPVASLGPSPLSLLKCGGFGLIHDGTDPLAIYLHDERFHSSDPLDIDDIVMQIDGLADLVGAQLANELGHHIKAMLQSFIPGDETKWLHLRFQRMEEFNEMFLELCEFIAHETHLEFDKQARLEEFLNFWTDTDGDTDVPAQIAWYAENGPCQPGEAQDDYDTEARDFLHLVQDGYLATAMASMLM